MMMFSIRRLAVLSVVLRPAITRRTTLSLTTSLSFLTVSSSRPVSVSAKTTTCFSTSKTMSTFDTGYLDAESAASLDQELMSVPGFSLEQLMELAGLSVAEAVYAVVPNSKASNERSHILLVCGPGNNGGDGLVAARHLVMFGYDCTVVYPKRSSKQHFVNLVQQCHDVGIVVQNELPGDLTKYSAIVDAIFGFSFHGEPREPFATILTSIQHGRTCDTKIPVIAVDVPSGWNVDLGDVAKTGFVPDVLVSLTAPKLCARDFLGRHFVGGRFLPPALGQKYGVRMPDYPGVSQVVEVTKGRATSWEHEYAAYLAEKEAKEFAAYAKAKPSDDSWEAQYTAYLTEKEGK